MKVLTALIVAGALIAMTGVSVMAAQPASPMVQEAPLRLAQNDDFAARKDAYVRKSGDEMTEWRNKIRAKGEQAETKGHEVRAETKAHFERSWAATERAWQKLKGESAEGWDKSKSAYERSVAELRGQWHKMHPEDND